jgi:serine/threonine-protein kinase RsbW
LVQDECAALKYGRRQLNLNVPVALTEALSNAILRGNERNPDKRVHVTVRVDSVVLVIEVADEGAGFDLDMCTIDPTTPDRLESEAGRGLFLMKSLMDRVERYSGDPGNVVRLTLRRAS